MFFSDLYDGRIGKKASNVTFHAHLRNNLLTSSDIDEVQYRNTVWAAHEEALQPRPFGLTPRGNITFTSPHEV